MIEKNVYEATKYGEASNNIEDLGVTKEEINDIRNAILNGSTDDSFLFSVVRKVMIEKGELDNEEKHNKIRK